MRAHLDETDADDADEDEAARGAAAATSRASRRAALLALADGVGVKPEKKPTNAALDDGSADAAAALPPLAPICAVGAVGAASPRTSARHSVSAPPACSSATTAPDFSRLAFISAPSAKARAASDSPEEAPPPEAPID